MKDFRIGETSQAIPVPIESDNRMFGLLVEIIYSRITTHLPLGCRGLPW